MNRFAWSADDVEIASVGADRYTWAPGDVVVSAARSDSNEPLDDDDLDALHDLDGELPQWDVPTEDDGGTDEFDDGVEEWRTDDLGGHGYNPNRAHDGKFAPGAHHEPHHEQPTEPSARPWRLAFDARPHQKQIDSHKETETVHRAASLKLLERMNALKARAASAAPRERSSMQRKFATLEAQRATHQTAAASARAARAEATKDLEAARAEHAAGRKAEVAARRSAAREGIAVIGRHRIAGAGEQEAGDSTPIPERAATPDHHFAIGSHRIAGEPEAAPAPPRELTRGERYAQMKPPKYEPPAPHLAPMQTHESAAERQRQERAARHRYEAGRPRPSSNEMPHAAHVVALPEARVIRPRPGVLSRARSYLRGLLGG